MIQAQETPQQQKAAAYTARLSEQQRFLSERVEMVMKICGWILVAGVFAYVIEEFTDFFPNQFLNLWTQMMLSAIGLLFILRGLLAYLHKWVSFSSRFGGGDFYIFDLWAYLAGTAYALIGVMCFFILFTTSGWSF